MRIVYLHQYFLTPDMAGGSRSFEMARRLVAAGHEVHMVTSDQAPEKDAPAWRESEVSGIRVHWASVPYNNEMGYRQRLWAFFAFAWRAARKAGSLRGDIIFATSTPLTIALPAVYAARRSRRPMVFEVRDLWPAVPIAIGAIRNPVLKFLARWLERFAYRNSDHVIALAPGMRTEIINTGYPAERVSVIPNGCDLETFSIDDGARPGVLRDTHPWLGLGPIVLFTGTFGLVNGMDYLVHLAVSVGKIAPEVRFVAIGSGREFLSTRELAAQMGVLDRSLFLLGKMPKRDLVEWMHTADMTLALFTGPEIVWRDAVQNKFFDSLAAGKPVANNFPGWQSLVAEQAGAGVILDAHDTDEAARQLVAVLRDPDWLASASLAARDLAEGRFDRGRLGTELARILESVAFSSELHA